MGLYRRTEFYCKTCRPNGGRRLARKADREACKVAGHKIEARKSQIWWVRYSRAGKWYSESSDSDRSTVARRLLRQREGDVAHGKSVTPKLDKLTFEDAAKDLLADYTTNGKKSYKVVARRIRKHLEPFFGGRRMADITPTDVRAYVKHRQEKGVLAERGPRKGQRVRDVSNGEVNRELDHLRRMYTLALDAGTLSHRPKIAKLNEDNIRAGFFEPDQLDAVLAHLPQSIRPVIEFASITGWRIASEILPLQWRQIDFNGEEVRLDAGTTKNRQARTFPFTDDLRRILDEQRTEHERLKKAGHVFPFVFFREVAKGRGGKKEPRRIVSFTKVWKTACRSAGCPGRIPHDLRRTAIRTFVRESIPERVAMQLSGHKTRSVFERYNIVSEADLRDAARRLNGKASARIENVGAKARA